MYLFKYSILVFLLSISFSEKNSLSENNVKSKNTTNIEKVKPDPLKIWEKEDNKIDNPELKMQLETLRKQFETNRNNIQNDYKSKIKILREQSRSDIDLLRKNLVAKRNEIQKQYGYKKPTKIKRDDKVKPDKIKADKKVIPEKINKPKSYNPPKGVKPTKAVPSKPLDNNSKSKAVPVKDVKSDKN